MLLTGRSRWDIEATMARGPIRQAEPADPLDDLKNQDPSLAAREATDRLMAEIDRLGAAL